MSPKSQAQKANEEEARKLLEQSLKSKDRGEQDELLQTLEHSTVALRLAIAYIKSVSGKTGQEMKIDQYLKLYKEKEGDLKIEDESKNRVILIALKLSLDAIKKNKEVGLEAEKICLILAYFAIDKPIPMYMFFRGIPTARLQNASKALELLTAYGIVFFKMMDQVVRNDCLIQEVIRANFKDSESATLEKGLLLIAHQNLETAETYHAMALWDHASKHGVLVKKYHGLVEKIMSAMNVHIRDDELLVQFGKKQVGPLEKHLGPRHQELLRLKSNLSAIMGRSGAGGGKVEARKLFEEIKAIAKNKNLDMEGDHPQAQCNEVMSHSADEKDSEAPKLSQEVLDDCKSVLIQLSVQQMDGYGILNDYKEANGGSWRGIFVEKLRKIVRDSEYVYESLPYSDSKKNELKQSNPFMIEANKILMKERFSFIHDYEDN